MINLRIPIYSKKKNIHLIPLQDLSHLAAAVRHLQHGSLLLGIRALSARQLPMTLTASHPERKKVRRTALDNRHLYD